MPSTSCRVPIVWLVIAVARKPPPPSWPPCPSIAAGATLTLELSDGVATGARPDYERSRSEYGTDTINGPPSRACARGADRKRHERHREHRKSGELEGSSPEEGHK